MTYYQDEQQGISWNVPQGVHRATCIAVGYKEFKGGKLKARLVFAVHVEGCPNIIYRAHKIYKNFTDDRRLRKDLLTWFGDESCLKRYDFKAFVVGKEGWVKIRHKWNPPYSEPFREIVSITAEDPRPRKRKGKEVQEIPSIQELSRRIDELEKQKNGPLTL